MRHAAVRVWDIRAPVFLGLRMAVEDAFLAAQLMFSIALFELRFKPNVRLQRIGSIPAVVDVIDACQGNAVLVARP